MIELERDDEFEHEVWADAEHLHVIAPRLNGSRWYLRDEDGEEGPYSDLADAFGAANVRWGEITLAPANRLRADIETGRTHSIADYLLEYLVEYGTAGIDAQALAQRVFERIGEEE